MAESAETTKPAGGRVHVAAVATLFALLLVMALRLTMTESLNQSFAQVNSLFYARVHPPGGVIAPETGPAVTLGFSAVVLMLAGAAAWIGGMCAAITWERIGRLLLIAVILAFGVASMLAAAGKFAALIGLCDVAMSMLGGWAVSVLCHRNVLGSAGRRIVVACLVSILAVWVAKGLYQRMAEIPDTIDYYQHHKEESLASQGIRPDEPGAKLYEARMYSVEVTGYVTLSNVMGAGMIGLLAALAGVLAGKMVSPETEKVAAIKRKDVNKGGGVEISVLALLLFFAVLLVLLGIVVAILTKSRGGSILGVAALAAIFLGTYGWQRIVTHRKAVVALFLLLWIVATAAVVVYGIKHDRLPTPSLMFRWHYWTGSVPLIEQHPMTGVGLNNFGDYYASVKRLSTPETVSDPHSFFVRLAAEMGIPAAALIALLIAWCVISATRVPASPDVPASDHQAQRLQLIGVVFCVLWWVLHLLLAETSEAYSVILSFFALLIAIGGWLVGGGLLTRLNARGLRITILALLVGAVGMLAYDQINMALVTGPVATLFWIMLMAADSYDGAGRSAGKVIGAVTGVALVAAGGCVAGMVWYPTLNGTMPWDDRPYIDRYLTAVSFAPQNLPAAKEAIATAIALNPRSVALRRQQMLLKVQLHEPVEADEREILALDHADREVRKHMAMEPSSLSPAERIRLLKEVLFLDDQLPQGEVTRLTSDEMKEVEAALAQLQAATRAQKP